jgi:hypothetical protein
VEEVCQQHGTTTNKIHTQGEEVINLIWEDIYKTIVDWRIITHSETRRRRGFQNRGE